jgi:demethylmenaquinone methyltransferase/2-methoxy-6-polyprenyl-1,4-benzoquinol methylase
MFDNIAPDYDRFNAWASLGLHQYWRRRLVSQIPKGSWVLDIATGTGDLAFLAADEQHGVVGLDFSEPMLARARAKDVHNTIRWVAASADKLPFSDGTFGCVTSAFALRNLRSMLDAVFRENFRILKAGGKALHLDFGRPRVKIIRWGHWLHLSCGIPLLGKLICGKRWPKGYLESTIEQFYEPEDVKRRLQAAGFKQVKNKPLLWGVVQLFEGTKEC